MAKVKYYAKENSSIGTPPRLIRRLLPLHQAKRTSPRVALAKVATRAAVRLAESWRDDLRDVRCKM